MKNYYPGDIYDTPPEKLGKKVFFRFNFYRRIMRVVFETRRKVLNNKYDDSEWNESSYDMLRCFEDSGIPCHFRGMNNINSSNGATVFIGNHMSTAETFLLPSIILPRKKITFIVKKDLMDYPVFGPIMRSRSPIAVGRKNSKEDFVAVMTAGIEKLKAGISLVIFPQSTRMENFSPRHFNSIGIKLAKKAGVPVIPFALRTDCWGNGALLKDFGPVRTDRDVYIEFASPFKITGNGKEDHSQVIDLIKSRLTEWDCSIVE